MSQVSWSGFIIVYGLNERHITPYTDIQFQSRKCKHFCYQITRQISLLVSWKYTETYKSIPSNKSIVYSMSMLRKYSLVYHQQIIWCAIYTTTFGPHHFHPHHAISGVCNSPVSGIILGMGSANERLHYNVMLSLIGWAHIQNDLFWVRTQPMRDGVTM